MFQHCSQKQINYSDLAASLLWEPCWSEHPQADTRTEQLGGKRRVGGRCSAKPNMNTNCCSKAHFWSCLCGLHETSLCSWIRLFTARPPTVIYATKIFSGHVPSWISPSPWSLHFQLFIFCVQACPTLLTSSAFVMLHVPPPFLDLHPHSRVSPCITPGWYKILQVQVSY